MSASIGRPETTSPIIHGSTIEGTVSWTPFPLALNGPESAYRTILQKLPRDPRSVGAFTHIPIHGRLPLRKGFRRGWHSGLGCCHPFGLNDHRSLASMRSAGRLPIIFSGSWPWESDGLRRPRSDRSCHPQRSPSQLVEAFQGRIDLIRPKPSIDLPENALAPPSSARLTPPHGRSRHDSAGPRGSVPACSRPRPRRR